MADEAYVLEGTYENFPELVLGNCRKGPVLVDFWAGYAGPSLRTHLDLILAGRDSRSPDELRAEVAERPEDPEPRFRLAAVALAADDYDTALAQATELARRSPDFRGGLRRGEVAAMLDTLEPDDPRVKRVRQSLFEH